MKAKGSIIKQEGEFEVNKEDLQAVDSFFKGIVPTTIKELSGILSDSVKFWRWKNQVNIVKKAQLFIDESGLSKSQIPMNVAIPLLEKGSLEEDSNMQGKWASLLANATTGNISVTPKYVSILSELSPIEASLLDKVYDETLREADPVKRNQMQFGKDKVCQGFGISTEAFDLMLENLIRLGLLAYPGSTGIMFGNARVALRTNDVFEMTTLGSTFVKVCRKPTNN